MPRTSKYTPELVEHIVRLIEAGVFAIDACMAVGIGETTYYEWLKTKREFRESIKKARAKAIVRHVLHIEQASKTDWKAAAWWLERVARDRFGRHPPKKPEHMNIVLGFEPKSAFIQPSASEVVLQRPKPIIPRKKVRD